MESVDCRSFVRWVKAVVRRFSTGLGLDRTLGMEKSRKQEEKLRLVHLTRFFRFGFFTLGRESGFLDSGKYTLSRIDSRFSKSRYLPKCLTDRRGSFRLNPSPLIYYLLRWLDELSEKYLENIRLQNPQNRVVGF